MRGNGRGRDKKIREYLKVKNRTFDVNDALCGKGDGHYHIKTDTTECPSACEEFDVRN